jgi:hypothetical protein
MKNENEKAKEVLNLSSLGGSGLVFMFFSSCPRHCGTLQKECPQTPLDGMSRIRLGACLVRTMGPFRLFVLVKASSRVSAATRRARLRLAQ